MYICLYQSFLEGRKELALWKVSKENQNFICNTHNNFPKQKNVFLY
jgi:hypothetical protein